jgi:hypothetical protein
MTPEEKAKELVYKYWDIEDIDFLKSKQCAELAVDEIINIKLLWYQKDTKELDYWNEVKKEIKLL